MFERRVVLASVVLLALTGCSLFPNDPAHHELDVENQRENALEVSILIERNGEAYHEETRNVLPHQNWDVVALDNAGTYEITIEVADGQTVQREIEVASDEEAMSTITLGQDGGISIETRAINATPQ